MLELKNLVFEVPADDGGTKRIIDDLPQTMSDLGIKDLREIERV